MRVIIPAVPSKLHPSVVPAILRSGYRAEVVNVVGPNGYFDLFAELWDAGDDFVLVEHDIQVAPGVLRRFETCPALWCAHSYDVYAGDLATAYGGPWGLGCVRFRAELMGDVPQLVEHVGADDDFEWPARHWACLDSSVTKWLKGAYRQVVCHHAPAVTHHHTYRREVPV